MLRRWLRVVAVILTVLAIACGREKTIVDIELDAFSGRPNPKWTISGEPARETETRIASLSEKAEAPVLPDLGFRGFLVTAGGRTWRVFHGRVQRDDGWYRDTAGIEAGLKRDATERGFGKIVSY